MEQVDMSWDYDKKENRMFMKHLAPIVLFTYNRLEHTQRTVEALQRNVYAKESQLFIYSDAPKNKMAYEAVSAVRKFLHNIDGFKCVKIIERKENWGLAKNIIDGVTKLVNQYGKIIVLEDDILTSQWFLKYMNDALEVYQNEPKVMAISGYFPPVEKKELPESFFLKSFHCWGWGTWRESWSLYKREPERIRDSFTPSEIEEINVEPHSGIWQQVIDNCDGRLYTWAIFFVTAIFKNYGLVHYSNKNFCINIGMDNSGEHCGKADFYDLELTKEPQKFFTNNIQASIQGNTVAKMFYEKNFSPKPLYQRVYSLYQEQGAGGVLKKIISKIWFYYGI